MTPSPYPPPQPRYVPFGPACGACHRAGRAPTHLDRAEHRPANDDQADWWERACPACGHRVHVPPPTEAEPQSSIGALVG